MLFCTGQVNSQNFMGIEMSYCFRPLASKYLQTQVYYGQKLNKSISVIAKGGAVYSYRYGLNDIGYLLGTEFNYHYCRYALISLGATFQKIDEHFDAQNDGPGIAYKLSTSNLTYQINYKQLFKFKKNLYLAIGTNLGVTQRMGIQYSMHTPSFNFKPVSRWVPFMGVSCALQFHTY